MTHRDDKVQSVHHDEMLDRTPTAGAISISPELFEQLYLAPKNRVEGQLRQTFGNPTPLGQSDQALTSCLQLELTRLTALGGFLLCTTPMSMVLLEWQGAGGFGAAANV